MSAYHREKWSDDVTILAVLAVLSPVILIMLVAVAGVLVVWFALFIVRALFWLAIGGLIGLALWAGEARAGTGGPHGEPAPPMIPCVASLNVKELHEAVDREPRPIPLNRGIAICKRLHKPITIQPEWQYYKHM